MGVLYTAEAASSGDGRSGSVHSSDGVLSLALTPPKELGGAGTGANPEQLFAAGYAACFHSALRLAARERGVRLAGDVVTARVHLERDGSGYGISADLEVSLPGLDRETGVALAEAAHGRCPYSRAVRGNVRVGVRVLP
ncbi:organic hydroperoxide resistance protein [Streptomyces sp. NPDC092296]|uniref:organic hydroperoxide resistance protein n=1 Tax=Streptomyces sp. NPDC092296 TaxID=3366012 RepID=UPI0037F258FF